MNTTLLLKQLSAKQLAGEFVDDLEAELAADPTLSNWAAADLKPRFAQYPFTAYLHYLHNTAPATEAARPFLSGALLALRALIRLAERQAATGNPEFATCLKGLRDRHFVDTNQILADVTMSNVLLWRRSVMPFQIGVRLALHGNRAPKVKAALAKKAWRDGVFAMVSWVTMRLAWPGWDKYQKFVLAMQKSQTPRG